MSHPLPRDRLVIATHNQGKLGEFADMLSLYVREIISAGSLGLPEPTETGTTFAENALLKANAAAKASGIVALADDSGLCVNALGGQPGIYSARWAGPGKDFNFAMKKIHEELGDKTDRSAYFTCVLALAWPNGHHELIEGRIDGHLVWPPRGDHGHGYDPVFVPNGHSRTFAEMAPEEKHAISHRGIAVHKLTVRMRGP
jgi:XTP/dITP diphosphohydrolase